MMEWNIFHPIWVHFDLNKYWDNTQAICFKHPNVQGEEAKMRLLQNDHQDIFEIESELGFFM